MKIKYNPLTKTLVVQAETKIDKHNLKKIVQEMFTDKRSFGSVSVNNKQISLAVNVDRKMNV